MPPQDVMHLKEIALAPRHGFNVGAFPYCDGEEWMVVTLVGFEVTHHRLVGIRCIKLNRRRSLSRGKVPLISLKKRETIKSLGTPPLAGFFHRFKYDGGHTIRVGSKYENECPAERP
jgi:hypothetical protein